MEKLILKTLKLVTPIIWNGKNGGKLVVLIYHRVLKNQDFLMQGDVDCETFDWQKNLISKYCQPLSLGDAVEGLKNNTLPSGAICVTFDDGYRDNYTNALPILKKYNVPATVFVATSFLDGGCMWNDLVIEAVRAGVEKTKEYKTFNLIADPNMVGFSKHKFLNNILHELKYKPHEERQLISEDLLKIVNIKFPDLMMSSTQVLNMHNAGIDIGAHTTTHPILKMVSLKKAPVVDENLPIIKSLLFVSIVPLAACELTRMPSIYIKCPEPLYTPTT